MPAILSISATSGKIDNLLRLPKRFGANRLWSDDLHYENPSYLAFFTFGCCVPGLLRERTDVDHDYDHDPRDDRGAADDDTTDNDYALLVDVPTARRGHVRRRALSLYDFFFGSAAGSSALCASSSATWLTTGAIA
jgi:hypothetical protein